MREPRGALDSADAALTAGSEWRVPALPDDRARSVYEWPRGSDVTQPPWRGGSDGKRLVRPMPEDAAELRADSRWPALFPSALCLVTAHDGTSAVVEKVVGASIVNRFPYIMALSFCREPLSDRHYARSTTMDVIERAERVAVQFIMPGDVLDRTMRAIATIPETDMAARFAALGLSTDVPPDVAIAGSGRSKPPILPGAYLVYHGRLVRPGRDFDRQPVNSSPWHDVGSHRLYLFEIEAIALEDEIACGARPIHWRSLPVWREGPEPARTADSARAAEARRASLARVGYTKTYRPDYVFPSADTVAFAGVPDGSGFSVLPVPPLAADQVEVDNDRARWPCFFPSSLGMITAQGHDGRMAAFPCGSTAVVSRHPFTIGICVSYARINARYAPRASLSILRDAGRFGCGVPIHRPDVLEAIGFLGNLSLRDDQDKASKCGLTPARFGNTFGFAELPVHFDCRIVGDVPLGTHALILGEVEGIHVDGRLTAASPLEWCPWAGAESPRAGAVR